MPTPHEELFQLQKSLYRSNQRIIKESILIKEPDFTRYEATYKRHVQKFEATASIREMLDACRKADIIYVGDYHTCNQSQRSFLRILKAMVQSDKNIMIGLELFHQRHQKFMNDFLRNKLSEKTFLKKVALRRHWIFDLWENFKPILDFARYHDLPVFGIDAAPRGSSLGVRDKATAQLIAKLSKEFPNRRLFILIGDLHIAPPHLPKEAAKALKAAGLPPKSEALLYQNSEAIYWKLAERQLEHHSEVVRINEKSFCRMHTPPVILQQSYLNWLEHEEGEIDFTDAKHQFVEIVERIAKFLGIEIGKEKDRIEVYTSGDLSFLEEIKKSKRFTKEELEIIKQQIVMSNSYYIPKFRIVYLSSLSLNHAAEEAAHFIKHSCSGEEKPRDLFDAFYANVLHEALGFFGSKIINHKRKCNHERNFQRIIQYLQKAKHPARRSLEYESALMVVEAKHLEARGEAFSDVEVFRQRHDLFYSVSHALGYMLGDHLYYALLEGVINKAEIRHLFYHPWRAYGQPFQTYWTLLMKTKVVKIPKRM